MKSIFIIIIFLISLSCYSQTVFSDFLNVVHPKGVYSYDLADSLKVDFNKLANDYKSLWDDNLEFAQGFITKEEKAEKISGEWNLLLQNIGIFLSKNNYNWDETTTFSVKFYFDENGNIDYLFYKPLTKELKDNSPFIDLLNKFIKSYKFNINAKRKYSQCGSVIFQPKSK